MARMLCHGDPPNLSLAAQVWQPWRSPTCCSVCHASAPPPACCSPPAYLLQLLAQVAVCLCQQRQLPELTHCTEE